MYCNWRCVFCYNPRHSDVRRLGRDEWLIVLDDLRELGTLTITLTGGEAMASPDFFPIARAVRDRSFALRIFTNGSLVTPDAAKEIAKLHSAAVEMSLHGATAEVHDRTTGRPGSFDAMLSGLATLRAEGVRTLLKTPVTNLNEHQIDEMLDLAASLGVKYRMDATITPRDDGDRGPLAYSASRDAMSEVLPRSGSTPEPSVSSSAQRRRPIAVSAGQPWPSTRRETFIPAFSGGARRSGTFARSRFASCGRTLRLVATRLRSRPRRTIVCVRSSRPTRSTRTALRLLPRRLATRLSPTRPSALARSSPGKWPKSGGGRSARALDPSRGTPVSDRRSLRRSPHSGRSRSTSARSAPRRPARRCRSFRCASFRIRSSRCTMHRNGAPPPEIVWLDDRVRVVHDDFQSEIFPFERRGSLFRRYRCTYAFMAALRTALSAVLPLDGGFALHGAAVCDAECSWAFFGPSGAGKTTLASTAPFDVISDEEVIVRGRPFVLGANGFWGVACTARRTTGHDPGDGARGAREVAAIHLFPPRARRCGQGSGRIAPGLSGSRIVGSDARKHPAPGRGCPDLSDGVVSRSSRVGAVPSGR